MQFKSIQILLVKGRIPKGQRTAFLDPCRCRFGCCNVDLMLSGSGNLCSQTAHDVLLIQNIDQSAVILLRNQIAAVRIHAFLQDIGYLTEIASHSIQHCLSVLIGSTAGLWFLLSSGIRSACKRRIHRPVQLLFSLLCFLVTVNGLRQILDFCLHLLISGTVLRRKHTIFILMGIHKILRSLPHLCSLFDQFLDSHNQSPP